jgi:hypothetical protein
MQYRFMLRRDKPFGRVQISRLRKSIAHRKRFTRSDQENCKLCSYYREKHGHCVGCPAYAIYVSQVSYDRPRAPYSYLCEMYQRLSDDSVYADGSALPAELYVERLLRHIEFLDALDSWLAIPFVPAPRLVPCIPKGAKATIAGAMANAGRMGPSGTDMRSAKDRKVGKATQVRPKRSRDTKDKQSVPGSISGKAKPGKPKPKTKARVSAAGKKKVGKVKDGHKKKK